MLLSHLESAVEQTPHSPGADSFLILPVLIFPFLPTFSVFFFFIKHKGLPSDAENKEQGDLESVTSPFSTSDFENLGGQQCHILLHS